MENLKDSSIKKNYNKPILVFWFDAPPRAGSGVFKYVSEQWGNQVYYICLNPLREERKIGGWREINHGRAEIIYLSELNDPDLYITDFIEGNPNAIHIFNGFRSHTTKFLNKHFLNLNDVKLVVWSERPGVYGGRIEKIAKRIILPLIHRLYYLKYRNKIKILMPLGKLGISTFSKFGWKKSSMYPFMYNPEVVGNLTQSKYSNPSEPVKILYVGRFARSTKGIDILIKAFNKIENDNWVLNLVGGYGEYKNPTITWANNHSNVQFLGTWSSDEVAEKISQYDLVIVPSKFDGWNVIVNEALLAGVGVIASNAAVSHELIETSGAGMVVRAGDVYSLQNSIQSVLNQPDILNTWKDKAKTYSKRISSEVVGDYLIDILDYTFINSSKNKPSCPWL